MVLLSFRSLLLAWEGLTIGGTIDKEWLKQNTLTNFELADEDK